MWDDGCGWRNEGYGIIHKGERRDKRRWMRGKEVGIHTEHAKLFTAGTALF